MTTLTANLKHYYQCRSLWTSYAVLLFLVVGPAGAIHDPAGVQDVILVCLLFSAAMGSIASGIIKEVVQKPFVFLLPGHEASVARATAVVGIFAAIFWSLPMLRSSTAATQPFSVLLGSASAALMCYWFGVFASFYGILGLVGVIVAISVVSGIARGMTQVIETSITGYAVLMAVISTIVFMAAYRILSRWDLRRRYCMKPDVGTLSGYVSPERARQRAAMKRADFGDFAFDSFFMRRILKAAPYSLMRQAWAAFYRSLRPMLAYLRRPVYLAGAVILLVALVCACGIGQDNGSVMFLAVGALSFLGMPPAIQTWFPSAFGRRERFGSLVIVSIVRTVLAVMMGVVCGLFSSMVAPLMPGFFVPANMQMFFLPVFVAPLAMIGVESHASYRYRFLVPMLIVVIYAILVGVMWELVSSPQYMGAAWTMTVVVWVIHISGLFWVTARCDLVARRA